MATKSINFEIVQGDTFILTAIYKDPSNQPIDITGYSAIFQVKDKPDGKVICATVTSNDYIVIDGPNGKITVTIPADKTKNFTIPQSAYQLQINSGSQKTTIADGFFSVRRGTI